MYTDVHSSMIDNSQKVETIQKSINGWMDGWMDRWVNGWMCG